MTQAKTPYTWLDPEDLGRAAAIGLYLVTFANAVATYGAFLHLRDLAALDAAAARPVEPLPNDLLFGTLVMFWLFTYISTGVLVIRWIYRVSRNAHAAADGLVNSPASSVWWYLVPLMSLFKPFQAMNEVWAVSRRPDDWRAVPTPDLLKWWWGLFLLGALLSAYGTVIGRSETVADERLVTQLLIAGNLAGLGVAILFSQVVRNVTAMQVANLTRARGRRA